jgi:gliding motility-associated-like protein
MSRIYFIFFIFFYFFYYTISAQNKINNPSFEKDAVSAGSFISCPPNPLTDWLTPGNAIDLHDKGHWSMGVPIGGGDKHVDINPNGKIQQLITGLTVGDTCYLSFYTSVHHLFATGCGSTSGTANMSVSCGTMFSTTLSLTGTDKSWTKKLYKFIATATSVNLVFEGTSSCYGNGGVLIDELELIQDTAPPCDSTKRFANAGKDTNVCIDASGTAKVFLNASGGVSYNWSPASLFSNPNLASVSTNINSTTTFVVKVTDANGCIDRDSVNVKVNPLPIVKASPNPIDLCVGKKQQLQANGTKNYKWIPSKGLSADTVYNPLLEVQKGISKYIVVGSDENGCSNKDSILINVLPGPIVKVSPSDTFGCIGTLIQLNVSGATLYNWYPASPLNNGAISNPILKISGTQKYFVEGRDTSGCLGFDSLDITAYPLPKIIASKGIATGKCGEFQVQLNATGGKTYLWWPSNFCDNPTIPNPIVKVSNDLEFIVTGVDERGCIGSDSLMVSFDGETTVNVPNVFTPNGDGINDRIRLLFYCPFDLKEFSIFNRWGQMVYSSNNPNQAWDGTFNGEPCNMDVYYYLIKGVIGGKKDFMLKGDISLLR